MDARYSANGDVSCVFLIATARMTQDELIRLHTDVDSREGTPREFVQLSGMSFNIIFLYKFR